MTDYSTPMNFIDLSVQQKKIRNKIDAAIARVLDHGQYIMGPEVKEFEGALKDFTGAKNVLTCGNGTDALSLVLMAWGVGPGDAIFVPSFTYVASAEAPAQLGATPFFVDVLNDTFNIDPESLEGAINEALDLGFRPAVVIAVDLFGQPADIKALESVVQGKDVKILVDGAQSLGGMRGGRSVGAMGDATTTSFFPAKPLGGYGDGGAVFTENDALAAKINSIRLHGRGSNKYDHIRIGINSRLDTLQAAILIEKLKLFPDELNARQRIASRYEARLSGHFDTPKLDIGVRSSWAQYTLKLKDRDAVKSALESAGIPSVIYYPMALTQQVGYRDFPAVKKGTPVSDALPHQVLSLPFHPYLEDNEIDFICDTLLSHQPLGYVE